jgi:hypothetical protein
VVDLTLVKKYNMVDMVDQSLIPEEKRSKTGSAVVAVLAVVCGRGGGGPVSCAEGLHQA